MASRRKRASKLDPYLDQLGVVPDRELAELAGVTVANVRAYRKRHGVAASWRKAPKQPTTAASSPRPAGQSRPRKSKLDPFLAKVGQLPDREVAELAGVSAENVRAFRKRRGIPASWRGESQPARTPAAPRSAAKPRNAGQTRRGKLTPFREVVGVLTDSHVARLADTAAQNVRAYRLRHGIPARWRGEGQALPNEQAILALYSSADAAPPAAPAAPVTAVAPAPAPAADDSGLEGYAITVQGPEGEISYVVVANDIAEAAAKAVLGVERRGIEGRLVSVRFLARALGS